MTTEDILKLIAADPWMMKVLNVAHSLRLPDWWIGGGFVRNKVWDKLHRFQTATPLGDIDVIYFDPIHLDEITEKELEQRLTVLLPGFHWSCTNQARMRSEIHGRQFSSLTEALLEWPETATSIAVKLNDQGQLELLAPFGIDDLINLRVSPTPNFLMQREKYEARQAQKNWVTKWPRLQFYRFPK